MIEMELIAAMSVDPGTYHSAISKGADRILTHPDTRFCLKLFDPITGEFDAGGLVENRSAMLAYNDASQEILGPIGEFRLRKIIDRVRKMYQQAKLLAQAQSPHETPDDQLNSMTSTVLELSQLGEGENREQREIEIALENIDKRFAGNAPDDTIQWPMNWLHRLGPIGKQELVVVGGRPGGGKSAFMGQVAYEWAHIGVRVLFITLEMSKNELRHRWAAYASGFSEKRIDGLSRDRYKTYRSNFGHVSKMDRLRIGEHYTISAIVSAISRAKINQVDAVFVDYLQLIVGQRGVSRLEQISDITRTLKLTAKDLSIPIIVGSQLNRESEKRELPGLSSLRESGTIEQDADRVLLLHYDEEHDKHKIIQAKCRNGSRTLIDATFTGETTSFAPLQG